jgi:hypothetical protein
MSHSDRSPDEPQGAGGAPGPGEPRADRPPSEASSPPIEPSSEPGQPPVNPPSEPAPPSPAAAEPSRPATSPEPSWLPSNQPDFGAPPRTADPALQIQPTVGGAYAYAWNILKADFWMLLLIGFVAWLLMYLLSAIIQRLPAGGVLSLLFNVLVAGPIFYGAAYAWLRAVRGERPEVDNLFEPFRSYWLKAVLANILLEIVLVVGFLLLIIPGIFLSVRLAFVPFLVVDEGLGPIEALTESFNRTTSYGWTIFGTGLLAIVIIIVGLIIFIIGSIPATMWVYLAFASLYAGITARKRSAVPTG